MLIKVYGDPIAKGSMRCIGARGRGRHTLIDNKAAQLAVWTPKVIAAAAAARDRLGDTLSGPVTVTATFTIARPASVPLARRPWPEARSAGDIDKLTRAVLDALTSAQLINDDSQVNHTDIWRCYPDTPGCPDRLPRPGAAIRIEALPHA